MRTEIEKVNAALMGRWGVGILHRLEQIGLIAWEISLPAGLAVPAHEHELPFFCVLLDGWMESEFTRRAITYHRFVNVFHPAGTVHTGKVGPAGARILTLETSPSWGRRLEGMGSLPPAPACITSDDSAWVADRLLRELRQPHPCSALVLEGLTLELLAAAARPAIDEVRAPAWLSRVIERLHEELERPVTVERLAADIGIHPARLSTVFRRHTGRTVGDYRRDLQVGLVRQRLRDRRCAGEPLAQLALEAGFADQAHCTRVFKAATGWTPARYRAAALAGQEPPGPAARAEAV